MSVSAVHSDAPAVPRRPLYLRLALVACAVIVLDQYTKHLALERLADGPVDIGSWLSLRLSFNPGGAFGVLSGAPGFFLAATLVIAAVIVWWAWTAPSPSWAIPLGLILGGGLGNATDRLFRSTDGMVVDFIDLHWWPIFNVADSAIVCGVTLLLIDSYRRDRRERNERGAPEEEPP
ncbi:MAG TPA: signal peptidase II [Actinomycetota bacterium]|nr:signal peptidase II [Actinomycetota bacterium]